MSTHKSKWTWIHVLADPGLNHSSTAYLHLRLLNVSKPEFLYLEKADNKTIYCVKFL